MQLRQLRYFLAVAEEGNISPFTQTHLNARMELWDLATKEMLAGLESHRLDVVVTVGQPNETRGIAAGHCANASVDKPLAVFVEELRKVAHL